MVETNADDCVDGSSGYRPDLWAFKTASMSSLGLSSASVGCRCKCSRMPAIFAGALDRPLLTMATSMLVNLM
jgi:hypothetical protein